MKMDNVDAKPAANLSFKSTSIVMSRGATAFQWTQQILERLRMHESGDWGTCDDSLAQKNHAAIGGTGTVTSMWPILYPDCNLGIWTEFPTRETFISLDIEIIALRAGLNSNQIVDELLNMRNCLWSEADSPGLAQSHRDEQRENASIYPRLGKLYIAPDALEYFTYEDIISSVDEHCSGAVGICRSDLIQDWGKLNARISQWGQRRNDSLYVLTLPSGLTQVLTPSEYDVFVAKIYADSRKRP